MTWQATQPIGIFDSGIGGLSIARAVAEKLPCEQMIYFGDTAHFPYGEKSTPALQSYAVRIVQLLLEQGCKLILIACNSASAAAFDLIKEYVVDKALVVNVIDPVVEFVRQRYRNKCVGLIGTKQTVNSQVYQQKIQALNVGITLKQHATPLLAAAIEEQFTNQHILDELVAEYLSHPHLQQIDGLILGCTHYPLIKQRIAKFYDHTVEIIDASDVVADAVKYQLDIHGLLHHDGDGNKRFYVSDYTESFMKTAHLFFNEAIELQPYSLW